MIGKTNFAYLETGIEQYAGRLTHYLPFQWVVFLDVKNGRSLGPDLLKVKEGESILEKLKTDDFLVLLDERGKEFSSMEFATFMGQKLQLSHKRIIFLIGGAFGFSKAIYERADFKISLSKLTFSHQMVRLFFLEQLYRAMTILKGESYHNE
jgi:23S rRNA (pseudouridine1915-N3)-methyltransferase